MAEETVVENETEAATNPSESSRFNEEDVQVVAKTAAELVQQALGQHEKAIEHTSVYGHSLMEMASDELEILAAGKSADNVEATHKIATLLAGALAVDRLKCPAAVDRHAIAQQAHDLMESATISDGFSHDFCEAHAIGIRAAQASQRKPTYTPEQYRLILEVIAGRMDTLRRLIESNA